jgi:L-gulonolactone oxidase
MFQPTRPLTIRFFQTLAGVITTATHGTGYHYGVLSSYVLALTLMLPDGSYIRCSREQSPDIFKASLCGLGGTGLILSVKLQVEPTTRLEERQWSLPFDDAINQLPSLAPSAEHVRLWWFPQSDMIRVSSSNRTSEVCGAELRNGYVGLPISVRPYQVRREAGFGTRYLVII